MEDIHFIITLRQLSLSDQKNNCIDSTSSTSSNGSDDEGCSRNKGQIKILEQSITSSVDDLIKLGVLKYTLCNHLAYILLFYCNVDEETVYRWCYIRIPKLLYFITI